MELLEFIKQFVGEKNEYVDVLLEWFWDNEEGEELDEEYSYEGDPKGFVENYTNDYDNIDGFTIFDVDEIRIKNSRLRTNIYIKILRE